MDIIEQFEMCLSLVGEDKKGLVFIVSKKEKQEFIDITGCKKIKKTHVYFTKGSS